jgi:hypothetical protein
LVFKPLPDKPLTSYNKAIKNRRSYPKTIFFEIKSKKERPTGICNIAAIPTGRFFNILSAT